MSHVSFSKLISVNYPKLYPKPPPQPTLAEVLQSEPVKRLLSQPNIVIETIPSACVAQNSISNNNATPKNEKTRKRKNSSKAETQGKNIRPEISIMPVEYESKDESRLLPAKGDGKSEIALHVVKVEKKKCGHREPCENIICDVLFQQYVDHSGVLPMLAVGIKDDEINAPVSKHCKNPLCDALSIEHDRCRRALIKIYRCDKMSACDICNVVFKTRRARMSHKNCTRKEIYRHNQTNGAQILREKMRERELEMIQAAKSKRKEYLDPVTEYKKYMEMLRNNKELIVIPKNVPPPQPIITITTVPSNDQFNSYNHNNSHETFGKFVPSIPLVFPPQGLVVGKRPASDTSNEGTSAKQTKLANVFCSGLTVATVPNIQTNSGQQFIKVTSVSQPNFVQPVSLNDWFVSQANAVGSDKGRIIKPFLTPIRVVPITSLKSAPSLRHQTHGIPAFCLVPDSLPKSPAVPKLQTIQPAPSSQSPTPTTPTVENETENEEGAIRVTPKGQRRSQGRRKSEEKNSKVFKCPYCLKGFSTDWYFKMHVAGHTGEMLFACKTCEKPFSNRYDMKKHMLNDHNDGECRCEICGQISICKSALEIHIRSHTGERPFHCSECDSSYRSSTDLKTHQRKRHDFIDCLYCNSHFVRADLKTHLISSHTLTEDEALQEILANPDQIWNGNESSDILDFEVDVSDCESISNETTSLRFEEEELMDEEANETDKVEEADGTDEVEDANGTDEVEDTNETDEVEEANETDEVEEANETDEVEEANGTDELEEVNGTGEVEEANGTDEVGETNGTDKVEVDQEGSNDSKKRKKTTQNGNKSRVSKSRAKSSPRGTNGKKDSKVVGNDLPVLKQVANNSKVTETQPAVRRSSRRSHSNVQCTVCKDHFESTTLLENHLANKSKETVECQECKSHFHSQTEYKKHNATCGKSSCKQSCKYPCS